MVRQSATIIISVSVAILILWLAIPRAAAGFIMFEARDTLRALRAGREVSTRRSAKLMAAQSHALTWSDSGELWANFGFARLAINARKPSKSRSGIRLVAQSSEFALRQGLSRSPVNGEAWYWLAVVQHAVSGVSDRSVSSLRLSIYTGPHIPPLAIIRLRLLLRHWKKLDAYERDAVYRQIQFAWSVSPNGVVDLAVMANNDWPVRVALARQPKALQRFEAMLKKARAKLAN